MLYVLCYRMDAMADGGTAPLAQLRSLPLDRCDASWVLLPAQLNWR